MKISWQDFEEQYGPLFHGKAGRYTADEILTMVLTLARHEDPGSIIEIGTAFGHTTVNLAVACPLSQIYTFDICREMGYDKTSFFAKEVPTMEEAGREIKAANGDIQNRVTRVLAPPADVHGEVVIHAFYDFAFIDGDHRYEGATRDTHVVLRCVKDDAMIVWDDFQKSAPGVERLIGSLNSVCGHRIVHVQETRGCFIKLDAELRGKLLETTERLCRLIM